MMTEAENPLICSLQTGDPGKPVVWAEGLRAGGQTVQIRVQVWRTGNSEGRRRSGSRFSAKRRDHEASLGCQQAGWCPSTLGRAVCFIRSSNSHTAPSRDASTDTCRNQIPGHPVLYQTSEYLVTQSHWHIAWTIVRPPFTGFVPSLLLLSSFS